MCIYVYIHTYTQYGSISPQQKMVTSIYIYTPIWLSSVARCLLQIAYKQTMPLPIFTCQVEE